MRRCEGITEPFWAALSEDQRVYWKYFSRFVAIVGALFVTKTGNRYIDWSLFALTGAFLLIVIETQRSYSRLSPKLRKSSVRVAIALGSWGIAIFGVAVFSQAGLVAIGTVFSSDVFTSLKQTNIPFVQTIILVVFLAAAAIAPIKVFRDLRFEELIYDIPRKGLIQLLVHKQPKATSFPVFAYMELVALLVCLFYASSVADIAKVLIKLVGASFAP